MPIIERGSGRPLRSTHKTSARCRPCRR